MFGRRFSSLPLLFAFGSALLLSLNPIAQPDEAADLFAVSTYTFETEASSLILFASEGGAAQTLEEVTAGADDALFVYASPSFSPDGSQIVYIVIAPESRAQIYVYQRETGESRPLIDDPDNEYAEPVFSPDGQTIAFTASAEGSRELDVYTIDADGSGMTRLTETPDFTEYGLAWSPDGQTLAYMTAQDPDVQLYLQPAAGGEPSLIDQSEQPRTSLRWSPDGQRLFFESQTPDELGSAIYSIAIDGSDLQTVYEVPEAEGNGAGISWLTFSTDGERLAFVRNDLSLSADGRVQRSESLRILTIETGEIEAVAWDIGAAYVTGFDWITLGATDG